MPNTPNPPRDQAPAPAGRDQPKILLPKTLPPPAATPRVALPPMPASATPLFSRRPAQQQSAAALRTPAHSSRYSSSASDPRSMYLCIDDHCDKSFESGRAMSGHARIAHTTLYGEWNKPEKQYIVRAKGPDDVFRPAPTQCPREGCTFTTDNQSKSNPRQRSKNMEQHIDSCSRLTDSQFKIAEDARLATRKRSHDKSTATGPSSMVSTSGPTDGVGTMTRARSVDSNASIRSSKSQERQGRSPVRAGSANILFDRISRPSSMASQAQLSQRPPMPFSSESAEVMPKGRKHSRSSPADAPPARRQVRHDKSPISTSSAPQQRQMQPVASTSSSMQASAYGWRLQQPLPIPRAQSPRTPSGRRLHIDPTTGGTRERTPPLSPRSQRRAEGKDDMAVNTIM